ncbi:hypothetical protein KSS87_019828 [Heliosperma pusillum]|nr:hypothetical protein KSS87_019828 [Heliosperma pusillum]
MEPCCNYPVTQIESCSHNDKSGGFDCNICLDSVQDPVVTLCGHLYCWPCIYKWLQVDKPTEDPDRLPECPVCKTEISHNTLIPLYGRGKSGNSSQLGLVVPQRPKGKPRVNYRGAYPNHTEPHSYNSLVDSSPSPAFGFAGTTTFYPVIGLFSEMIYSNSESSLYTYHNTYGVATTSSARARRNVMQKERSLSRVCFFLFCCIILCLLLF